MSDFIDTFTMPPRGTDTVPKPEKRKPPNSVPLKQKVPSNFSFNSKTLRGNQFGFHDDRRMDPRRFDTRVMPVNQLPHLSHFQHFTPHLPHMPLSHVAPPHIPSSHLPLSVNHIHQIDRGTVIRNERSIRSRDPYPVFTDRPMYDHPSERTSKYVSSTQNYNQELTLKKNNERNFAPEKIKISIANDVIQESNLSRKVVDPRNDVKTEKIEKERNDKEIDRLNQELVEVKHSLKMQKYEIEKQNKTIQEQENQINSQIKTIKKLEKHISDLENKRNGSDYEEDEVNFRVSPQKIKMKSNSTSKESNNTAGTINSIFSKARK